MAIVSIRSLRATLVLLASLLLAGCVGYPGAYPGSGGYGGGYGYPDRGYGAQVVAGSVQAYDPGSGRLLLATDGGYGGGYGSSIEVWANRDTRLYWQGREHDVSGLERGDRVRVEVQDDGRRLWARTIEVTHNVREGGGYRGGGYGGDYRGGYDGAFEAAVRYVDPSRRVIEVTRGGYAGSVERVWYDDRTRFYYRGQPVSPTQLEAGDLVRIDARQSGSGWIATSVTVTRNARTR